MKIRLPHNPQAGMARHAVRAAVSQTWSGASGATRPTYFKFAAALLLALSTLNFQLPAHAQGTAFTYQGRFNTNGAPYTGSAEFQFTLWDSLSDGNVVATNNPVAVIASVTDGLFTATLDFGSNPFNGQPRFLQIEARTGISAFTTLTPRQPLTPTPYALRALNLTTNGLTAGTYASAVTFNNAANTFNGAFTGNGAGLNNVNASALNGLASSNFWQRGGNAGANPTNGAFLGTTDNLPLEFKVNGQRALRIEYASNDTSIGYSPNLIAGYNGNIVSNGVVGAVISGGGYSGQFASVPNRVGASFATVVGGSGNSANGVFSVAMGYFSTASGGSSTAMGYATEASGDFSTAMGISTTASGDRATAMGNQAKALHDGSFVWADHQFTVFSSTTNNQFSLRASGGVRLSDDTPALSFGSDARQMINLFGTSYGIGVQSSTTYFRSNSRFSWFRNGTHSDTQNDPGAGGVVAMTLTSGGLTVNGVVVSSSDRHVKTGFTAVDTQAILAKVVALPIQRWYFTNDVNTPHLGAVAQDFHAAFNVGEDDRHIATVDADGVALAAIQGLNQKVEKQRNQLEQKEKEITELKQAVNELKDLVEAISKELKGGAK